MHLPAVNLSCFSLFRGYSYTITLSNVGKLNWSLIFLQTCPSSEREINFGHLIVMQKKSDANAKLLFCLLNLLLFDVLIAVTLLDLKNANFSCESSDVI